MPDAVVSSGSDGVVSFDGAVVTDGVSGEVADV